MESGSDWSRVWENRFGSCATPIIPIPDFRWKTRMGLDPTDPALDPGRTWGMDDWCFFFVTDCDGHVFQIDGTWRNKAAEHIWIVSKFFSSLISCPYQKCQCLLMRNRETIEFHWTICKRQIQFSESLYLSTDFTITRLVRISEIKHNVVGETIQSAPSPNHHHVYRWYVDHSQSWLVCDIVLPTIYIEFPSRNHLIFVGFLSH